MNVLPGVEGFIWTLLHTSLQGAIQVIDIKEQNIPVPGQTGECGGDLHCAEENM